MLKKANSIAENVKVEDITQVMNKAYKDFIKQFIPKSKVKEKIEELNDYYKKEIYPSKYQWADIDITEFYDNQIGLLQELLGDEE